MSVSLKKRFEILHRDDFRCHYCGAGSPGAVLEIDHIVPESKGGGDEDTNIVTSCYECNRGKSDSYLGREDRLKEIVVNWMEGGYDRIICSFQLYLLGIEREIQLLFLHNDLDEIYDAIAFRIILEGRDEEVYHALGIVHSTWRPVAPAPTNESATSVIRENDSGVGPARVCTTEVVAPAFVGPARTRTRACALLPCETMR